MGLAIAGSLWALLTLPLVAFGWSWPAVDVVARAAPYVVLRDLVGADAYIVYGALGALSFLAIGLALLPDLRRAGWGGTVFAWLIIAGAVVTTLSYLGTPEDSPLHPLWGSEGILLVLVGVGGVLAAITAGRRWALWTRILMGVTIVVLAAGVTALGYFPHGCLVTLGIEAVFLILWAPRGTPLHAQGAERAASDASAV